MSKKLLLAALFTISGLFTQLWGQTALVIGFVPLAEVNSEYLALSVVPSSFGASQFYEVRYGQSCLDRLVPLGRREMLHTCTGLKYANGDLAEGFHYATALTLLRRNGWELVEVVKIAELEVEYLLRLNR